MSNDQSKQARLASIAEITRTLRPAQLIFAQAVVAGKSHAEAYRLAYPKSRKWGATTVGVNAARLMRSIRTAVEALRARATDDSIMDVMERKRRLSDLGRADPADYVHSGADGSWITFGPESPRRQAVAAIKSRTEMAAEGSGKNDAVFTELSLRNPVEAIRELNRMERIGVETVEPNTTIIIQCPWNMLPPGRKAWQRGRAIEGDATALPQSRSQIVGHPGESNPELGAQKPEE